MRPLSNKETHFIRVCTELLPDICSHLKLLIAMNSSPLYSSETMAATPAPVFPLATTRLNEGEAVTSFQNSTGNIQPPKRCFNGRFEIVRRIGRGGFGTTYLAQDMSGPMPMPCVIKQLRYPGPSEKAIASTAKAAFAQERLQRRFHREARMMARLGRHTHLPCLLDHFIDSGQFYLVQEHIDGHTLSREIGQSGPQTESQVKQFLREMLPIVDYIHRQGLLHLDIKPSNIIRRSSDQQLVLIDFGAVRRYPNDALSAEPDRGMGTLGFAASEQLAGKPSYASDLYSLGVTCLYLLTKVLPLDLAMSPQGQNLRWQDAVSLSPHFTRILTKMLQPEAARRFQTIEELDRAIKLESHYDDLQGCLTTEPLIAQGRSQPPACLVAGYFDGRDHSHVQRQADSIRRWKQRRREFKTFAPK